MKGGWGAMTNKQENTLGSVMRRSPADRGQVILEFTFCMIVIMIMIFGITRVLFWTGNDLATRRLSHEERITLFPDPDNTYIGWDLLYIPVVINFIPFPGELIALAQIAPNYHAPIKMDAIWDGK
jgi:hypothetical protein